LNGQIVYNKQIYPVKTILNIDLTNNAKGGYFIKIAKRVIVGKLIIK